MRYNGIHLILTRSVDDLRAITSNEIAQEAGDYLPALTLGAIRDDILYLPLLKRIWEHWSFSHFVGKLLPGGFIPFLWPSAPFKANYFYQKALKAYRKNHKASAYVLLGRASHLIIDMACPVHASRVPHWSDPYEWYVDSHYDELKSLPRVEFSGLKNLSAITPKQLTLQMAKLSQNFRSDHTHHHLGVLLSKLKLIRSLSRDEAKKQAEVLVPNASACIALLLSQFRKEASPP